MRPTCSPPLIHHYKDDKPNIAVLKEEIKILNTLYSEKEEETILIAFRAKQKARREAVEAKQGVAKSEISRPLRPRRQSR